MREDWAKNHPEAAKRMEEMKARQEAHAAAMIKNLTKTATGSSPRKNCSPFPLITASPARTMPFPVAPKRPRMPNMDGPRRPGGPRAEGPPALPEDRKAAEAVKDAVKTVTGAPTATALTVPVPSLTPTAPRSWLPDGS